MKYLALAIALPVVAVIAALGYFGTPSVFAEPSARGVTIHCEVLHDYPSDVERIDITEALSGKIVWRVRAQEDKFQLHKFDLSPGANAGTLQPYSGQFQTDIPVHGAFHLLPGVGYRVSVCAPGWLSICRTAAFML